jgi:ribosome biogenesis GTPase
MPPAFGQYNGLVRAAVGGTYEVELYPGSASSSVVESSLRGRLKREQRTGEAVVVGDRVRVAEQEDGGWTIEAVADRGSELARRAPGGGRKRAKVLVANVDQIVAVFAVTHPSPRLRMLDRFLVLADASGVDALIVANKVDLAGTEETGAFEPYEAIGYPVILTSVVDGTGITELRAALCDRISALAGPSGAGKSSLLNALQPGLSLRTGTVSETVRKGRHTTVSSRLIPLECGGYVADTPGLRELGLWDVDPEELDLHFPELLPHLDRCRFGRSCTHTHEPACAVREAVGRGDVSAARYASYVALHQGD